ncbi:MAG: glutamate--cysteine ligase [Pseudomonadota bacterium]
MATASDFGAELARLADAVDSRLLLRGLKGVEKESLRSDPNGLLAQTPHPAELGSALTNRYITTDFSEALLEFVTPAWADYWQTHQFLCDLHIYTYRNIGEELLWVTSMPCRVGPDDAIPLACYGTSNVGRMKTTYRRGLGFRYGRLMQTIAGLHFNYSLATDLWPQLMALDGAGPDADAYRSARYLGLVRNFRRYGWLVLYLFGASPAVCRSFIDDPLPSMPELDGETLFEPYATSLRMSDLGYSNKAQSSLVVSLNTLDEYIDGLCGAITTPAPAYEKIGVRVDGNWRQLNANVLQIENEYYSAMRPKKVARSGERPTSALRRGGIDYVELRSVDLNLFDPVGISQRQAAFLELFLLYCLLKPSPPLDVDELKRTDRNHALTVRLGRDPGLVLEVDGRRALLAEHGERLFDELAALAEFAGAGAAGDDDPAAVVAGYRRFLNDADLTPSARIVSELSASGQSFFEFGLAQARRHRDYFLSLEPVNEARMREFAGEAVRSIEAQRSIEATDALSFSEYLAEYFAGPCGEAAAQSSSR